MNPVERVIRRVDAFQQGHAPLAFVYGVVKKYGNDNAGALTVQLTYSLFTTVFPLLLLLVTVLSLVLAGDPSARKAVLHSTFSQFPLVGSQLSTNIHVMKRNSTFGLAVGMLGLAYGTTGLAGAGMYTMEQVWNIPGALRPGFVPRMFRSLAFLATLGIGVVATTGLSTFGTFGRHNFWLGVLAELLAAIGNIGLYVAAFRILTPKQVETGRLVPGALFGGVVWTVLQALGGYVVGHYLRGDSAVYGTFGAVLGLIAWIYLGAEITVYAAELNTVLARRLWPRGMVQPPLTEADQRTLALQAIQNQRRPEQEVVTRIRGRPMTQREYLTTGGRVDDSVIGTEQRVPEAGDAGRRGGAAEPTPAGPAAPVAPVPTPNDSAPSGS
jgi:YihY family inner membrane protein